MLGKFQSRENLSNYRMLADGFKYVVVVVDVACSVVRRWSDLVN